MLSQRCNLTLDLQRNEGPVHTNQPRFDVCGLKNFPVQGLSSTMGMYGGEHIDTRDCLGSFTHVYAHSDLPKHYYPGRFHLLKIRVYVVLDNHVGINFSSLYFHGSSPPYPPGNAEPLESAVRYAAVLYPPLNDRWWRTNCPCVNALQQISWNTARADKSVVREPIIIWIHIILTQEIDASEEIFGK